MAKKFILSCIIMASFVQAVFLSKIDGCPAIRVKKDQIIRTKEAMDNGAKFIEKKFVQSARDCYRLCCESDNCNLGMLSYKNNSNGHLVRTCYLFDCGSPSRCTFSPYKHYATITFEGNKKELTGKVDKYEQNSQQQLWNEGCPRGVPVVKCYSNPCDSATCPSNPWALCRQSECGSCHAEFVNDDGDRVKCYGSYRKPQPAHSSKNQWSQQEILKEIDRLHQKNYHLQPVHHRKNNGLETHLNHYTKNKPVTTHQSRMNSITGKSLERGEEKVTDPPFHQWREFIDNNPKYARPKVTTEKPMKKPTTFHQWREFIDNNPKYTRHPPKPIKTTQTTTLRTTQKITHETIKKMTTTHVIPKTKPVVDEKPITNSPPRIEDDGRRASNISDVVVIETSTLHIVENKAVVPLAIFLVVALILLFVVALRLRVMKSRLRRKAFATDDADYLINGMYL